MIDDAWQRLTELGNRLREAGMIQEDVDRIVIKVRRKIRQQEERFPELVEKRRDLVRQCHEAARAGDKERLDRLAKELMEMFQEGSGDYG